MSVQFSAETGKYLKDFKLGKRRYSDISTFKIFSHSILFGLQGLLLTMPTAVYFKLFKYLKILGSDE